ncbi:MAG TPA: MBL fold metallo-hydrolase [Vicinamibacterales bacterium]|nr:MBL fold metallo-hydrolase [Vicinamibacterales bacterium]
MKKLSAFLAAVGLATALGVHARAGQNPVNTYAGNVYAPPRGDGEIHAERVRGQLWLLTGEAGGSNVIVQLGDQGVLVVDTGTKEMSAKLLAQIQRLAQEHGGEHKEIRKVINTSGRLDHVGGNEAIAKAGSQIISGEERAQQTAFVSPGAEVVAHENVLRRMSADKTGAFRGLEPSDPESFEVDNQRFNGEAVQIHHPHDANTDGQLVVLFRAADVVAAGDVVDMASYPIIEVKSGGTIDGELVALNKVIAMAAPGPQAEGGTLIVPGHGRMCDQADVALYRNMLTIIRNTVQYYKNEGKTLQQVLDLKPSSGYDQRWGTSPSWTPRDFITAVYETLPAKGPVFFSMKTATTVPSGKVF